MRKILCSIITCLLLANTIVAAPDEGMYPLSELKKVDLKKAGLKISQTDLYNPNGKSLIDALVNVGGCTGSFVSSEGLIITNHHCAFGAVQLASTPEKDYLTNGFVARSREQEIEAKGLTCRITESYEDVSAKIAAAVAANSNPAERINLINAKITELVKEAEAKEKGIKAEVSEMFIGRTYVLFRYRIIQDVRLVYIPQRSIGEFGGESDNWVWPRHTGDFSFMRAYVAPDGSSAKFAKNNVPYTPKKFLKINPKGINENDFVFILGYPGRTFRNRPAAYVDYQQQQLLPYISSLFEWQNQQMEETGMLNKADALKQASRIKGKANVLKNYKGKIQGLQRTDLVNEKRKEDNEIAAFIGSNAAMDLNYSTLLQDIEALYAETNTEARRDLVLTQLIQSAHLLNIAYQVTGFKKKLAALEGDAKEKYYRENGAKLAESAKNLYASYVAETDFRLLKRMLEDAAALPDSQQITAVTALGSVNWNSWTRTLLQSSALNNPDFLSSELQKPLNEFYIQNDALLYFALALAQQADVLNTAKQTREGKLNKLMADYVEVKMAYKQTNFIPDANSTLRLTYGYVRGATPADATYYKPFTGLKGIIDKGQKEGDYVYPEKIEELYAAKDFGKFAKADMNDVPVAFLYNLDTSGGNSGSPVMNAKGELVGVNFDRTFEATINDFAWNESYSRSIGVDIRYVLWVAQKIDNADFILKELGVSVK